MRLLESIDSESQSQEKKILEEIKNNDRLSIQEIPNYFEDHQILLQMAENIKKFYMYRNISSMYLKTLIDLLIAKGDVDYFFDEQTCHRGILSLCQICPYWIQILRHDSGNIVKIAKSVGMPRISNDIRNILLLSK